MALEGPKCLVHHVTMHPMLGCPLCASGTPPKAPTSAVHTASDEAEIEAAGHELAQKAADRAPRAPAAPRMTIPEIAGLSGRTSTAPADIVAGQRAANKVTVEDDTPKVVVDINTAPMRAAAAVAAVAALGDARDLGGCSQDPAPSCPDCGCDGAHTLGCARDDVQWTCDVTPSWWRGGDPDVVARGVSVALATAIAGEPGSMHVREVRAQRRRLVLLVDGAGVQANVLLAFRDLVRARVEASGASR